MKDFCSQPHNNTTMAISRLIYITRDLPHLSHKKQVKAALKGGAKHVQFRTKQLNDKQALKEAKSIRELCSDYGAYLSVNDHIQIALDAQADAVHLGLTDMPISEAKQIASHTRLQFGGTCNTLADVLSRIEEGVDYVGLGPFQYTSTKEKLSPILEEKGYVSILSQLKTMHKSIPVFAIGGIGMSDIQPLFRTGIHGIAMASVFGNEEEDIKMNVTQATQYIQELGLQL